MTLGAPRTVPGLLPAAGEGRLPLPLHGMFLELLAHGVPLGVRDYLDGLAALQAGAGGQTTADLRQLAETLWTRHPAEAALVRRWFETLPPTPAPWLAPLDALLGPHPSQDAGNAAPRGPDPGPLAPQHEAPSAAAPSAPPTAGEAPTASARIAVGAASDADGLALPQVLAEPLLAEDYLMEAQPAVTLRQLAVLWRRWRAGQRSGPRTELDVAATIRQRCAQGALGAPVMRARRRNAARLLVLADASDSMAPWQPFLRTLEQSLALGRLGGWELRWFANVPRRQVHLAADLLQAQPRDEWLAQASGAALLVVSDAGAARGLLNRRRVQLTAEFVQAAAAHTRQLVWINPMPQHRWAGSTAAQVAADARVAMLPLSATDLLRAVDLLRGHK